MKTKSLYYKSGPSDKEYHVYLKAKDNGFVVEFAYGRRGSALTTGTKTASPVSLEEASKTFDKLVAEKVSKGYVETEEGKVFSGVDTADRVTDLIPQLLNPITEAEVQTYLDDSNWFVQEKLDGRRVMVRITEDEVIASNRKGLTVALQQEIADELQNLPRCILDGELVGSRYVVFDILELNGENLRQEAALARWAKLLTILPLSTPCLSLVRSAITAESKAELYATLKLSKAEGVVFKRKHSPYTPGRPNSGGDQLKLKFWSTCTAYVMQIHPQRSIGVGYRKDKAMPGNFHLVGNVTIPPNHEIPKIGDLVEVRYLYAYVGGSLYQPVYLGKRDDVDQADSFDDLSYKKED